jgi:hypothetical protein
MSFSIVARQAVTLLRRTVRTALHRLLGVAPPGRAEPLSPERFRAGIEAALAAAPAGAVAQCEILRLPANCPPWRDTGIVLEEGDAVTWFANGRVVMSAVLDIYVEPHFQLWARVGGGEVFRSTRDTYTFRAERAGRLELASYFPGQWATRDGTLATPESAYRSVSGGMDVAVVRWSSDVQLAMATLAEMAREDPTGPAARELERASSVEPAPPGWSYLWFLGPGEIFERADSGDGVCMRCDTHCDVGILRREVDFPLESDTTLRWSWNVEALPSALAEDTLPTHDYLSIAVEYDNGIDVTYYWSAELPCELGYWCPLPTWKDREFHVVVRSGPSQLGHWLSEERNLYEDYRRYVGAPPARVRRVWFIANSLFQRRRGVCAYRAISIGGARDRFAVL